MVFRWFCDLAAVKRFRRDQGGRDLPKNPVADGAEETGAAAGMAGNPGLRDQQQDRVAVAIEPQFDEALDLPGGFALAPQPVAAPAEIADAAGGERLGDRRPVHPGEHQDVPAFGVLGDGGDQAGGIEAQRREQIGKPGRGGWRGSGWGHGRFPRWRIRSGGG